MCQTNKQDVTYDKHRTAAAPALSAAGSDSCINPLAAASLASFWCVHLSSNHPPGAFLTLAKLPHEEPDQASRPMSPHRRPLEVPHLSPVVEMKAA